MKHKKIIENDSSTQNRNEDNNSFEAKLSIFGLDADEIIVFKWLSDNKEHWGIPEDIDEEMFEEIIQGMISSGFIVEPLTLDDGYKLTLDGRKQLKEWLETDNSKIEDSELEQLRSRIKELESEIEEKEKIIKKLELTSRDVNAFDRKVTVKILLQLLIKKSTYGVIPDKMPRARLISRLTGFSEEGVKKLTDPDKIKLNEINHGEQIKEAKELLSKGNITVKL